MTEVGWIPKDWECNLFEDVLSTFTTGSTPYRGIPEYYQGNEKWVSSGELNYNIISETHEHITREAIRDSNLKVHEVGTFLMAITGLEAEGTRGKCAILGVPATTNQSCLAINSTDRMTTDYLFHYYQHFSNWYAFKYSQGTKQQSYKAEIVKKFPIIHPAKLSEQRRIAQVLSDTDSLIASLSRTIEKKRLVKQGAMQQLLTGKTRLKGFSGEWAEKKLGDIADIRTGKRNGDENVIGGLYPFFVRSQEVLRINSYSYEGEAIIVPGEGGIGKIFHYVHGKFDYHQRVYKVSDFPSDICTKYVYYYMTQFFGDYALNQTAKATVDSLRLPTFQEFEISIPDSWNEQFAIANILTTMDNEISSLETELQKYKALKQGMMQKLLTGQIRLK